MRGHRPYSSMRQAFSMCFWIDSHSSAALSRSSATHITSLSRFSDRRSTFPVRLIIDAKRDPIVPREKVDRVDAARGPLNQIDARLHRLGGIIAHGEGGELGCEMTL